MGFFHQPDKKEGRSKENLSPKTEVGQVLEGAQAFIENQRFDWQRRQFMNRMRGRISRGNDR